MAVVADFATTGSTANCSSEPADYNKELYGDTWTENGYVFTRGDGNLMGPDSITDCLKNFSEKQRLPHIHPCAYRQYHRLWQINELAPSTPLQSPSKSALGTLHSGKGEFSH